MATVLITGGTGFIGSHLLRGGLERGYEVTTLSLGPGPRTSSEGSSAHIACDLSKKANVTRALSGKSFDYVINLAGYINHSKYQAGGREVIDAHLGGLLNLIDALDWTSLRSFIQVGSSDEYGNAMAPQTESSLPEPISCYSYAKLAGLRLLEMLHRMESFPAIVLRFFLVYGPGQDSGRFIPQIIKGCLSNTPFPASEGHQLRDFTYIDDIVRGVYAAMENPAALGEVINLASGKPVSIREVVETIQRLIGSGQPKFGEIPYRKGENMELYADASRARDLLAWSPQTDLQTGLLRTIDYYREV